MEVDPTLILHPNYFEKLRKSSILISLIFRYDNTLFLHYFKNSWRVVIILVLFKLGEIVYQAAKKLKFDTYIPAIRMRKFRRSIWRIDNIL
jgi:hypothetical protein